MSEFVVTNNEAKKRYETTIDGKVAFLEYMSAGKNIVLSHTEVPAELEGQGIGGQLVKHVLDTIESQNQKVIVTCPFVLGYMQRHPEYRKLVFGYNPK
ncbi:MAG: GNAT family N-acetyltransferase [Chloroflexota bacterium]